MIGRVKSTDKGGKKRDGGVRVTTSLRKIDGKWLVVHEHVSVPFDMTTGQAMMSLAP
jgi:ketosteroid isomerase-like protein